MKIVFSIILLATMIFANSLEMLTKRLDKLEKENKELRSIVKKITDVSNNALKTSDSVMEIIGEMADEEKLTWGGDFSVSAFSYYRKDANPVTGSYQKTKATLQTSMRGNLAAKYMVNDKTQINTQLSFYKQFGNSTPNTDTRTAGFTIGDATAYFTEFYLTYNFTPEFWTRIGRLPSTDSLGTHLLQNKSSRESIYPVGVVNQIVDGMELGYRFNGFSIFEQPTIRTVFSKLSGNVNAFGETKTVPNYDEVKYIYFQAESELSIDDMGDNLLLLERAIITNNAPVDKYSSYGIYFQNSEAFNSPLSYHISLTYSDVKSKTVPFIDGSGRMFLVGAKYDILEEFKIGAEYNNASKYFINQTNATIYDPFNKYNVIGEASELFFLYDLTRNTYLRVNGIWINRDSTINGLSDDDWGWGLTLTTTF